MAVIVAIAAAGLPLFAANKPVVARTPAKPSAVKPATTKPAPSIVGAAKTNPLLPTPIAIDGFYADLSLVAKLPAMVPAGYEPAYTAADWQSFRDKFGSEADGITKLKPSGQIAFAQKLIDAATPTETPGLRRLLLMRAAAIAYRTKEGYPVADKAVQTYLGTMDKKSPAQVGALWTIANIMARTAVTPKPDRIRYDAVAAKANMQLALLMLDADQIDAAQSIIKQIAYHEGWLKSDPATRLQIARVRADVKQQAAMMDYLATQYQPAIKNDASALTALYFYGRFVKNNLAIVADLPNRVPDSNLSYLARKLDSAARGDMDATYAAAENLRLMGTALSDPRIRSRTLYAAIQLYDTYMATPSTEHNRVERTLARINREALISDGARKGVAIDPFAPPAPATAPAAPVVVGMVTQ